MAGLVGRFDALSGPLRAVFWMVLQCIFFSGMTASVRWLSATMEAYELVAFRGFFGLLFVAPLILTRRPGSLLRTGRTGLLVTRSVLTVAATAVWFIGLGAMPVSDAIAIQFTLPLFVVVGAGLFLGERVGWRRWVTVAIGFGGALVIIRPGIVPLSTAALLVLASALLYAGVHLMTKRLSDQLPAPVIVFYMNLIMLPLGLALAWSGWVWPTWADLPWLLSLGLFSNAAHYCMTRAYHAADASFAETVDFLRLPFAALWGWLLFRETSDVWTWVGACVIFVAVTCNTRFEARRAS
ncbi:MAG: DMT family transporter [Alphaproteobacteria bacterium]